MAANYVFDDAWLEERSRLGSLEAALDPGTTGHLAALASVLAGTAWKSARARDRSHRGCASGPAPRAM